MRKVRTFTIWLLHKMVNCMIQGKFYVLNLCDQGSWQGCNSILDLIIKMMKHSNIQILWKDPNICIQKMVSVSPLVIHPFHLSMHHNLCIQDATLLVCKYIFVHQHLEICSIFQTGTVCSNQMIEKRKKNCIVPHKTIHVSD